MANEEKKPTGLQLFNQTITNPQTQKYLQDVLGERKGSFVNNLTALVANNSQLQEFQHNSRQGKRNTAAERP